ncbi:MAG TPA: Gfo/Idh/MocA family oxidoreductase [Acidimicrobiales bacterium]|nr:Gfo/Idh/MocA family oxidoreductase [Acidimicrobiales bacterium]
MTIRLGFYGAGLISGVHTWMLRDVDVAHKIVAVCDPDRERASVMAQRFGADVVDEDALLDMVDAVFITTWTAEHERLVAKAAAKGRAIFCEKPLAFDAAAATRMAETVEAAGVVNQVGLVLRTSPAFRVLKQLVNDPRAGKTIAVVFRDDQYIPNQGFYASTWRVDSSLAGRGTLLEHSIHDVDMLQWIFGPVAAVSATCRYHHGYDRIDDLAAARLEFANGTVVQLTSVWHDILERGSLRHVEVFCDHLYVKLEGDRLGPVRWQFTGEAEHVVDGEDTLAFLHAAGDDMPSLEQDFLAAVRDAGAATPTLRDAIAAHQIVDALYASADGGGNVVTDVYRNR